MKNKIIKPRIPTRRNIVLAASVFAITEIFGGRTASAQLIQRQFPPTSELATFTPGIFPAITLNGRDARLSPGALIRNEENRIVLPASIPAGQYWAVYTLDPFGEVNLVWLLRADEVAREKQRMRDKRRAEREARNS